jgi:hypothetical protein
MVRRLIDHIRAIDCWMNTNMSNLFLPDLMNDLLGLDLSAPASAPAPMPAAAMGGNLMDLLGGLDTPSQSSLSSMCLNMCWALCSDQHLPHLCLKAEFR